MKTYKEFVSETIRLRPPKKSAPMWKKVGIKTFNAGMSVLSQLGKSTPQNVGKVKGV